MVDKIWKQIIKTSDCKAVNGKILLNDNWTLFNVC